MLTAIWVGFAAAGWGSMGQVPASQSRPAETQPSRYVVPADRPWWVREGVVIASVNQSLSDRAWRTTNGRTRTPTYNEREAQKLERSEATLKRLKALGVNLVLVPYGGFGPDSVEGEERATARETLKRCHGLGLQCGWWLPVGQVDATVWKADGKDVSNWLVLTQSGRPLSAPVSGRSFTSDAVGDVRARSLGLADEISKLGTDAMFVPDWRVPAGYEQAARKQLGEFLAHDSSSPPSATELLRQSGIPTSGESPIVRPWIAYRTGLLNESLREIVDAARRGQPILAAVDCGNPSRQIGVVDGPAVDPAGLLQGIDATITSSKPILERGDIRTQIADLKSAVAVGARCVPRVLSKLTVVQQLAFGGDCGGVLAYFEAGNLSGDDGTGIPVAIDSGIVAQLRRYRERRELYAEVRPVGDVVVWQPRSARIWASGASDVDQIRATSALVSHRIPFDYLYAEALPGSGGDAALFLAGVARMDEDRASDLRRYVSSGGKVVLVGSCAVTDSDGKTVARELAEYLTESSGGAAPTTRGEGRAGVIMRRFGEGRVVSIAQPGAPLNVRLTRRKNIKTRDAEPLEDDDLAAAVRAALGRGLSVEAKLDRGSAVELTRSGDGRRTVLHVVNFNPDAALAATTARVRVSGAGEVTGVWRYDIATDGYEPAVFKRGAGEISIEMKPVDLYDAYLIEQK